jgi:diguanylate cyclase (GGDEF)-like protein
MGLSLRVKLKLQKDLEDAQRSAHEFEKNLLEIKVEQERQLASTFRNMALFDNLTGIPNRTHYNQQIEKELARASRNEEKIGLLFLDLDGFKAVNDTQGHEAGDEVLKGVATTLKNTLRKTDFVARLAGDEFVVILTTISGRDGLKVVAEKIIDSINDLTVEYNSANLKVGCSIGGAVYPNDGADSRDLTKHADYCMYVSKKTGKNKFYHV